MKLYSKFLHLNYSHSTILFSLFLHCHTLHQSTTNLVRDNATPLPHNLATAMTLPPHPPMLIPSSCRPHDNYCQIFLLLLQPYLLGQFSLRAKIVFQVLQLDFSNSPISFSLFLHCHRLLLHLLSHL